ncbi:single-stranded DNA-binding protein [Gardnerella sp. Marseille-Q2328]|uniref:single-stranded DNA-binding protein n=1 Tax=Gardnerella sp. Marseille-Q2328 TaxID=2759694 RepID=UPI002024A46B|nr:single-stranded DNA-binding protein [Gardnerella sp. Marseille-Q2328]
MSDNTYYIAGNLTKDPVVSTTPNGTTVTNFTIAATTRVLDSQTSQYKDTGTVFMRCTAWRALAEHIAESLTKGMRVIAYGKLEQSTYEAEDGSHHTSIKLSVEDIGPSMRFATARITQIKQQGMQQMISQPQQMQTFQQAPQAQQSMASNQDPWVPKNNIDRYYSKEPEF